MSDETLKVKPLGAESVANIFGFSQQEADKLGDYEGESDDDLDQRFAEKTEELLRTYSLQDLNNFLEPIVLGEERDDNPPQFTSADGNVFTVEMAKQLHAVVKRELDFER